MGQPSVSSTEFQDLSHLDLSDLTCVLITANRPELAAAQVRRLAVLNAHILVLDGSAELPPAIAKEALENPKVRVLSNPSYVTRLSSVSEVQTEFTILMNDDHLFLPSGIRRNLELMRNDSRIELVTNPLPRVTVVRGVPVFRLYQYRTGFESTFYNVRRTLSLLEQLKNLVDLEINPSIYLFEALFDLNNHIKYKPRLVQWPIEFMIHRESELRNRNYVAHMKSLNSTNTFLMKMQSDYLDLKTRSTALKHLGFESVQDLKRHMEFRHNLVTSRQSVSQSLFGALLQMENRCFPKRQSRKDVISFSDWFRFAFQFIFSYRSLDTFLGSLPSQGVVVDDLDRTFLEKEIPKALLYP